MSCHVYHILLYYHFHMLGEFDLVWQKRHIPCADLFCTKSPNSQHTHGRVQNTVYTGWQIGVRLIMSSITYLEYEWYGGFQNHTYNLRLWYTYQTLSISKGPGWIHTVIKSVWCISYRMTICSNYIFVCPWDPWMLFEHIIYIWLSLYLYHWI